MCLLFSYQALILEVCDETDVAELKLKVNSYILLNIPIILGYLSLVAQWFGNALDYGK